MSFIGLRNTVLSVPRISYHQEVEHVASAYYALNDPSSLNNIYFSNSNGFVNIYNVASDTVIGTIQAGTNTQDVTVSIDGLFIYAVNAASNNVSVISTVTNTVTTTIPVGTAPSRILLNNAGTFLYVSNSTANSVSVIDTGSLSVVATIPSIPGPQQMAISNDDATLYVCSATSATVNLINAVNNTFTSFITVGNQPEGIVISPDGTTLYVTNTISNTVSVISTSSKTVTNTITVGTHPYFLDITPNGNFVYVPNYSANTISVIATSSKTVIATITGVISPVNAVASIDSSKVYISGYTGPGQCTVIDTASNTITNTVTSNSLSGPQGGVFVSRNINPTSAVDLMGGPPALVGANATFGQPGPLSDGLNGLSTGNTNGYLQLPNNTITTGTATSITGWIKTNNSTSQTDIFSVGGPSAGLGTTANPLRAAFYYPWFGPGGVTGGGWTQQGFSPFTNYTPSLGYYDSANSTIISDHITSMQYGNLNAGIASWWGPAVKQTWNPIAATPITDQNFPLLLSGATGTGFKWCVYYEKEGNATPPTLAEIQGDLGYLLSNYASNPNYLRINGKPVIFVYGNGTDTQANYAARWASANSAGNWYVILKVFPGYSLTAGINGYHQYGSAAAEDHQAGFSFSISPGYWKKTDASPLLVRNPTTWIQNVKDMVASNEPIQVVTTFNEFGEGSPIESTTTWPSSSGQGTYLDAMNVNIPAVSAGSTYSLSVGSGGHPFVNIGSTTLTASSLNVADNQWHYLACTYDGTQVSLFVDGALVSATSAPGNVIPSITALIASCKNATSGTTYFADIGIYNTVLTLQQIQKQYSLRNNTITLTGSTPPATPPSVTAVAGNAQATVSWGGSLISGGSPITNYLVSIVGSSLPPYSVGNVTSFVVPNLVNGIGYQFTVQAVSNLGRSAPSPATTAVTPNGSATIPDAPSITFVTAENSAVLVNWNAPASNGGAAITNYIVTPTPGSPQTVGNVNSYNFTGLNNGTSYTFTVAAVNSVGAGPASTASLSVMPATTPNAPTNVTATAGTASAVVNWNTPTSNGGATVTGYTITPSTGSPLTVGLVNSFNFTGLTNGTPYTFTVAATNSIGTGPISAISNSVTPTGASSAPGAPTGVTAVAGNTTATVTWVAPVSNGGSAVTNYTVTSSPTTTPLTVGNVTTGNFTGLTNGTTYTFTVKATNAIGSSTASSASNAIIPTGAGTNKPGIMVVTMEGQANWAAIQAGPYVSSQIVPNFVFAPHIASVGGVCSGPGFNGACRSSGPNYITWVTGSSWGARTWGAGLDDYPVADYGYVWSAKTNLFSLALANGVPYYAFAEGATTTSWDVGVQSTTAGATANGVGYYARHNAFAYIANTSVSTRPSYNEMIPVPGTPALIASTYSAPSNTGAAPTNGSGVGSSAAVPWSIPFYKAYLTNPAGNLSSGSTYTGSTGVGTIGAGNGNLLNDTNNRGAFIYYAPNGTNEGHDGSAVQYGPDEDSFLANFIPAVQATDWYNNGGIILVAYDNGDLPEATNNQKWPLSVLGANSAAGTTDIDVNETPNGGSINFFIIAKGLDRRLYSNVVNYQKVYSGGPTETVIASDGSIAQPFTQVGMTHSICDYYGWPYPVSNINNTTAGTITLPTAQAGGTITNGGVFHNNSSDQATHPHGAATNPLPFGYGSLLPILQLANTNAATSLTAPGIPTSVSATAGNATATVNWVAPASNGGSAITGYTITSFIGATAQTTTNVGNVLTATVVGLTNGSTYTFKVTATNNVGTSGQSAASNAVTPAPAIVAPGVPTGVTAVAGGGAATVNWVAPASNGGAAISNYTVTSSPLVTPVTVGNVLTANYPGLTNGTAYTFTVTATNSAGTSGASTASAPVTPAVAPGVPGTPTATAANATATVNWTAPASNGGSPITNYIVTPFVGASAQGTTTVGNVLTANIAGLTNGSTYTFKVAAVNAKGTGGQSAASAPVTPSGGGGGSKPGIMVIVMENTDYLAVLGTGATKPAPYLDNTVATQWVNCTSAWGDSHLSQPNYAAFASGDNWGMGDGSAAVNATWLGTQLNNAGIVNQWYMESGSPSKHNPAQLFNGANAAGSPSMITVSTTNATDSATNNLFNALNVNTAASLSGFYWLSPNDSNNGHDTSVATENTYLSKLIPMIQATAWYANGGVIIVFYDEGYSGGPGGSGETGPAAGTAAATQFTSAWTDSVGGGAGVNPNIHGGPIPMFLISNGLHNKSGSFGLTTNAQGYTCYTNPITHIGTLQAIQDWYGVGRINQANNPSTRDPNMGGANLLTLLNAQ